MSNTNTQPKVFEWTDELVKEFIHDSIAPSSEIHQELNKFMDRFKEKQQPIEERIKVRELCFHNFSNIPLGGDSMEFNVVYKIHLSNHIPEEKHKAIKQAIEGVLNNDTWLHQQVLIKRDKLNEQAESLFAPYDTRQTVDNTDLKPQPQDTKEDNPVVKSIPTFAEYLELHPVPKDFKENFVFWEKEMWDVYINTYWDKVRNKPKEEQSPVLFVTHDGVNVYGGEHLYSVDNKTWGILSDDCNNVREAILWNKGDDKIFSSKEAAEQYILENKPCLSFSEILEVLIVFDKNAAINKIKRIANTKINIQ